MNKQNRVMDDPASSKDPVFSDTVFSDSMSSVSWCSDILTPGNQPAPHWQGLVSYLNSLGSGELERRWQKARRMMYEHGAAYNVFNEKEGMARPWELDPIPFPVSPETWALLERGVAQRTRLLTAIYEDIYGPQHLIRNGHLPPELLFANPRYLRQCHDLYTGGAAKLYFYAVNLCRGDDGTWQVISHGTQAPSGAGYALENRIILSRIFPRMFHAGKVLRLAPFFKHLTHSVMAISGSGKREPVLVMLSSGPGSPAYFEQVFLSRYLGVTLVESSDLTVRGDAVFLKTLGGLHPVDVILRRINDMSCDPLVFSSPNATGIAGLVQAVRAGGVVVSNPLGSAVLETPGFMPFLPGICRMLLEEDLILPNVPHRWCGRSEDLAFVLDCLEKSMSENDAMPFIVTSAFGTDHAPAVDLRLASRRKKEQLTAMLRSAPHEYVALDAGSTCTVPVWEEGALKQRYAAHRLFSIAGYGTDFENDVSVMPGALTRVSDNSSIFLMDSNDAHGGSKDTWCFSHEPVTFESMMHHFTHSLEIHRESDLPSRVADNMLWLGRYVERTEGVLRVLRSLLNRLNSETRLDIIQEFPFLLRILASLEIVPSSFVSPEAAYNIQNIETELKAAMFSPQRPGSIRNLMQHVKRVAASVRDRLSNDSWHVLGRMENDLAKMSFQKNNQISDAQELVSEMILTISAFAGLALESMTRGMGWRFMDMGRRLERADYTITLLQSLFFPRENTCLSGKRSQSHDLEALLEVADSTITYHTRYRTILQKEPIVDLLLLDELNPRSAGFQMTRLSEHVEALPGNIPRSFRTKEEKITLDLTTQLRLADISHLMAMNQAGELPRLFQLLKRLKKGIQSLGDQITQHYLSRIETEQQMRISFDTDGFVGDDGAQGWKKS
ncbi:MAG: circularly permuted type 2 ATP-grasp protein [Desulfotignum sp.]